MNDTPQNSDTEYSKLTEQFGAEQIHQGHLDDLPTYPPTHRGLYFAHRDLDEFIDSPDSIVTGFGPSGPLHLGHAIPLYMAKRYQDEFGVDVYIPLSDDEKRMTRDLTFDEIGGYLKENIRDVLAVGFDLDKTHLIVDSLHADAIYPLAVELSTHLTTATVEGVYGKRSNVGEMFYPSVQTAHILLPQFIEAPQQTLVPVAGDQDPHIRVCRDIAGKLEGVNKPSAILSRTLPALSGDEEMSSSQDVPNITLGHDPDSILALLNKHAHSGGRKSKQEHRQKGGVPEEDIPFQYLRFLFESDDDELVSLREKYESGELLSGELKQYAAEQIERFLREHQRRKQQVTKEDVRASLLSSNQIQEARAYAQVDYEL